MPVRSLTSSVLRWPDAPTVDEAVRRWARQAASQHDDIQRIGYFGSYARGDWGVGSDLDLVIILDRCDQPFERRGAAWDTTSLPVPADVLVYTAKEWNAMVQRHDPTPCDIAVGERRQKRHATIGSGRRGWDERIAGSPIVWVHPTP